MTDKLKPCPFCGGEADTIWRHGYWSVLCYKCHAETSGFHEEDAVKAWNRRESMNRIVERLEEEKNCGFDSIDIDYVIEIVKEGDSDD